MTFQQIIWLYVFASSAAILSLSRAMPLTTMKIKVKDDRSGIREQTITPVVQTPTFLPTHLFKKNMTRVMTMSGSMLMNVTVFPMQTPFNQ